MYRNFRFDLRLSLYMGFSLATADAECAGLASSSGLDPSAMVVAQGI